MHAQFQGLCSEVVNFMLVELGEYAAQDCDCVNSFKQQLKTRLFTAIFAQRNFD